MLQVLGHVSVSRPARALFASHSRESDDDLNNQRQKNKSPGILRTRGLINWGKPRCQLRIKNNSLIILPPFVWRRFRGIPKYKIFSYILYNDLIEIHVCCISLAQEILLNLAGNSSIGFWVQSILNQVSNSWAQHLSLPWPGWDVAGFRFHWPRPLNNIFTFASWRENLWQNHATSCHKIYRSPALCSQVLSRNNRRMTSWSRVENTDNIQHPPEHLERGKLNASFRVAP